LAIISQERAERIAKSHPCAGCGEYSFKQVKVKPASARQREELAVAWHVTRVCGICAAHEELGIDDDGDVVYAG
jgi:hypothetical protein